MGGLFERNKEMTDERLEWHLQNWAHWMRDPELKLYYPPRSKHMYSNASQDFDAMVAAVDERCAKAVDALLDGLPVGQQCAINNKYLGAVFRAQRFDLDGALILAKDVLKFGLIRRGFY